MRVNYIEKYPGIRNIPQPDAENFIHTTDEVQFLYWLERVAAWTVRLSLSNSVLGTSTDYTGVIGDGQFLLDGVEQQAIYQDERYKVVPQSTHLTDIFDSGSNQIEVIFGRSCIARPLTPSFDLIFNFGAFVPTVGTQLSNISGNPPSGVAATFDGVSFPLYEDTPLGGLSGFVTITPEHWWPYARPDGTFPIYSEVADDQFIPNTDPEFISFLGQS